MRLISTMLKFKVQRFPTSPGSFSACVPHGVAFKDAFTANDRVHDPSLCSCPRFNDLLLSPKRLVLVAQTSNFVSPKWTFGKKFVALTSVAPTSCRPNYTTPLKWHLKVSQCYHNARGLTDYRWCSTSPPLYLHQISFTFTVFNDMSTCLWIGSYVTLILLVKNCEFLIRYVYLRPLLG